MASFSRKWRVLAGLGAGLVMLVGVYALAGFVLAPYFVQARLWPLLSENPGGRWQTEHVTFNPFTLSGSVKGFLLQTPDGGELAGAGEAEFNLDLAASLRSRAVVGKVHITQPRSSIRFDRQGRPNYAFLLPKPQAGQPPPKIFPFLLTELSLAEGRLAFEDASVGKGFKTVLPALNLSLSNVGMAKPIHFRLDVRTENQEALAAEGEVRLDGTAQAGEARLQDVRLDSVLPWLTDDPSYAMGGALSLAFKYRYTPESGFEASAAEARFKQPSLRLGGQPFLQAESASVQNASLILKNNHLELQALRLENLALQGSAPASAQSASVQGLRVDLTTNRAELQALGLENFALQGPAPSAAESVKAQGLVYEGKGHRVAWQSLSAAKLKIDQGGQAWAQAGGLATEGFAYGVDDERLTLDRLALGSIELKAPSPVEDSEGHPRPCRIESLAATGLAMDLGKRVLSVENLLTHHALLAFWLGQDGSPGFGGMPVSSPSPSSSSGEGAIATPPPRKEGAAIKSSESGTQGQTCTRCPARASLALRSGLMRTAGEKNGAHNPPWRVRLGYAELSGSDIALRDFRQRRPVALGLENLNLRAQGFDSAAGQPFWLGLDTRLSAAGQIALEGKVALEPLAANLKLHVDGLGLPPFQSYISQAASLRVVKGALSADANIDYDGDGKLRVGGDFQVADFASVDKRDRRDFANWKSLRLDDVIFESGPRQRLSVKEVIANTPYIRAYLDADRHFNIAQTLTPPGQPPAEQTPPPEKPSVAVKLDSKTPAKKAARQAEEPLRVVIGIIRIREGNMDFADLTIKPTPFAANIQSLDGSIRGLSSQQGSKAEMLLEGGLDEGGKVRIAGRVNPFSIRAFTDITLNFKNVNLTALSPYSGKFAGYRIEKGRLSMDLRYKLDNGLLEADNQFMFDHLVLGEQVESKDATTLPVSLAVSLLKDSAGRIDVSLPISGDLNNPDISIRGLLAAAATKLITKVVSSPFSLLGGLFGSGDETLESVSFAPGRTVLGVKEKDKLAILAKALNDRPGLNLDIKGAAALGLDGQALAELDLERQLKNIKLVELGRARGQSSGPEAGDLSEQEYRRLFTKLYRWRNPNAPELQGLPTTAVLEGGQLEAAKRKLLERWTVSEVDLRRLAQVRGQTIRDYLVKDLGLPGERIYLLNVKLGGPKEKDAKAMLSLSEF